MAFNGDVMRELAAQFLALAEKHGATVPLMIGHRVMGITLTVDGRHRAKPSTLRSSDRALRSCRTSSAGDAIWPRCWGGSLILSVDGLCGCLAIPTPRSADTDHALKDAREIGQAVTLMTL